MAHYFLLVKDTFRRIRINFGVMLVFVVLYTIVAGFLVAVITNLMSSLAMAASGNTYIGTDNFVGYIASPITIICIFVSLLVVGYIQMVEIAGLISLFEASGRGEKISLNRVVACGVVAAAKTLQRKNWSIILFLMFIIPFLSITAVSTINFNLSIPGFINDYLLSKLWSALAMLFLNIVLFVFTVKWILSLHVFVLEPDTDFKKAKNKSTEFIKGRFFKTILQALVTGLLWILIWVAVLALLNLIVTPIGQNNTEDPTLLNNIVLLIMSLLLMFLTPCINLAYLSAVYADYNKEKNELAGREGYSLADSLTKKTKAVSWTVVVVIIAFYAALFAQDAVSEDSMILFAPEIAAHRGSSRDAPENTMPAFELAVNEGVSKWIEFDVHQTADGEVIISHDDHIVKPPTDVTVHEVTLEELKKYDVGLWFSPDFKDTYTSSLEEFLDYCRTNNIWLNLEIKPTQYDRDLVEKTLEIVRDSGIEERVIISSLNADSLKRVKELEPDRITLYNMVVASGDVGSIPYADWYGIEETNITTELVANVHEHGGKVFVWTVNNPDSVQYLIDCGVDGINTDSPVEIMEAVEQADYHGGFVRTLRMMTHDANFLQVFIY